MDSCRFSTSFFLLGNEKGHVNPSYLQRRKKKKLLVLLNFLGLNISVQWKMKRSASGKISQEEINSANVSLDLFQTWSFKPVPNEVKRIQGKINIANVCYSDP